MPSPAFTELVGRLIEAMGQQMSAVRPTPEGLVLTTGDGFLYAFIEDPTQLSLAAVERLVADAGPAPIKLALLTPGRFPLALSQPVLERRGSVVEAGRFSELARGLGLGSYLGDEPRAEPTSPPRRLLPSARQLDEVMHRARTWYDWGVPALALRFYRQAAALKPEFLPARAGVGRSLAALGLFDEADGVFGEILALAPDDPEAALGRAAVFGARGHVDDEIRAYRALLDRGADRLEVRANLVAALTAAHRWGEAKTEVEAMIAGRRDDPQLRFLHAATLWKTGATAEGDRERDRARALGLLIDRERALAEHLGLPPPIASNVRPTAAPTTAPKRPRRVPRPPSKKARAPAKRPRGRKPK